MATLEVAGLRKSFGGVAAVRDVSFRLDPGEMLALIGPNGAGKSTCFNMLNGQLRPDAGTVRLQGRDITGLPPRRVWRLGVGRTFQITATFGSMTVRENVQMALLSHARRLAGLWRPLAAQQVLGQCHWRFLTYRQNQISRCLRSRKIQQTSRGGQQPHRQRTPLQ